MAAEVGGDGGGKKKGKKGRKKKPQPRIDMTPMVDLGFLLLTFFVLTTRMATPTTMPVVVPADDKVEEQEEKPKVSEKKILNLLIAGKDRIYHYQGLENVELNQTNYSGQGIRKVIQRKSKEVAAMAEFRNEKDPLIVLIKMTDDASYKNMVDILDEMNITEQKKYMLIDITPEEVEFIQDYEKNQNLESSISETAMNMGVAS